MDNVKAVLGCKHCGNTDLSSLRLSSLTAFDNQFSNLISQFATNQNPDMLKPKMAVGIHIDCLKCEKDTFIVPENYPMTDASLNIPEQCIVKQVLEQPKFSAVKYIMYQDTATLDKIVKVYSGGYFSVITEQPVEENGWDEIKSEITYKNLLKQGVREVEKNGLDVNSENGTGRETSAGVLSEATGNE